MTSKLSSKQEHAVFLMESLNGLKQTQSICDFAVEVANKTFCVHRNVLAACSGYFGGMFTSRMREVGDGRVQMKGVTEHAMEQCFNYMYTGEVEVTAENIYDVLRAADMIQLTGLRSLCIYFMEKNITAKNCLLTKAVARSLDLAESLDRADRFVRNNFEKIFPTDAFKNLQLEEVLSYFKDLTGHSNQTKWNAGISWVEFNKENRTEDLVQIMTALKIEKFPFNFLYATMWTADSVQRSTACTELLKSALLKKLTRASVNRTNCFDLLQLAKENLALCPNDTVKIIRSYISENFTAMKEESKFEKLEKEDILSIYESLPSGSYEEKWETALKWVKSDQKSRKKILPELMELIKIENFTHEYIQNKIFSESLVNESLTCNKLVIQALLGKATCDTDDLPEEKTHSVEMRYVEVDPGESKSDDWDEKPKSTKFDENENSREPAAMPKVSRSVPYKKMPHNSYPTTKPLHFDDKPTTSFVVSKKKAPPKSKSVRYNQWPKSTDVDPSGESKSEDWDKKKQMCTKFEENENSGKQATMPKVSRSVSYKQMPPYSHQTQPQPLHFDDKPTASFEIPTKKTTCIEKMFLSKMWSNSTDSSDEECSCEKSALSTNATLSDMPRTQKTRAQVGKVKESSCDVQKKPLQQISHQPPPQKATPKESKEEKSKPLQWWAFSKQN